MGKFYSQLPEVRGLTVPSLPPAGPSSETQRIGQWLAGGHWQELARRFLAIRPAEVEELADYGGAGPGPGTRPPPSSPRSPPQT